MQFDVVTLEPETIGAFAATLDAGTLVAVAVAPGGLGLAPVPAETSATDRLPVWAVPTDYPAQAVAAIEHAAHPRWVWWNAETAAALVAAGVRVSRCWDLAAVHRLLFGGWRAEPAVVWARLHELSMSSAPALGQLDLLGALHLPVEDAVGIEDPDSPVQADGHLRPEWVLADPARAEWASSAQHLARWAGTAALAAAGQRVRLARHATPWRVERVARSESGAESLCAEMAHDGLPIDADVAESLIAGFVGPRPASESAAVAARAARDDVVRALPGVGLHVDLRNPAQVKSMLDRVGVDVPDTRAYRLEPLRDQHPVVDALLRWRKAERIDTTFGYGWMDQHVRGGRLRGAWSGSDGAAGRMTAQAGLHNMPADLRPAVQAEPGYVFVRADLGQIEPRVLAAVSGDEALTAAAEQADLYAPVASRLGVERSVAKVAVLAAMYGQTSGAAGRALARMESEYPVALRYLRDADADGRAGRHITTYGGRLVRMWDVADHDTEHPDRERAVTGARGRFARNAIVQGAAAELFKAWAVTVRARVAALGATVVLCLHDEVLVHAPAEHAADVARLVEESLHEAAWRHFDEGPARRVRFVADVSVIQRWSDAKA